jgi:hypothetical protein
VADQPIDLKAFVVEERINREGIDLLKKLLSFLTVIGVALLMTPPTNAHMHPTNPHSGHLAGVGWEKTTTWGNEVDIPIVLAGACEGGNIVDAWPHNSSHVVTETAWAVQRVVDAADMWNGVGTTLTFFDSSSENEVHEYTDCRTNYGGGDDPFGDLTGDMVYNIGVDTTYGGVFPNSQCSSRFPRINDDPSENFSRAVYLAFIDNPAVLPDGDLGETAVCLTTGGKIKSAVIFLQRDNSGVVAFPYDWDDDGDIEDGEDEDLIITDYPTPWVNPSSTTPVPEGRFDLWGLVGHELGHATGVWLGAAAYIDGEGDEFDSYSGTSGSDSGAHYYEYADQITIYCNETNQDDVSSTSTNAPSEMCRGAVPTFYNPGDITSGSAHYPYDFQWDENGWTFLYGRTLEPHDSATLDNLY